MIRMKNTEIEYLLGNDGMEIISREPFAPEVCDFLDELSRELRHDLVSKQYPDILTFAFWIRKSNLQKLKARDQRNGLCIGKGLVFHIAPSNVPINFAYTWVFGLLSGNSNVVKVSSKRFKQTEIICRVVREIIRQDKFAWVQKQNSIVLYDYEDTKWNDYFSEMCDIRVIWGGDRTISEVRKSVLPSRSMDITFADRYSFMMISSDVIMEASDKEVSQYAEGFYNDTYLMDQNACSAPHLILWLGTPHKVEEAKKRFWDAVYQSSLKYSLEDVKVSEKYTILCEAANRFEIVNCKRYDNYLYVADLGKLPDDITKLRGKYGLFYQYHLEDINSFMPLVGKKVQTCSVIGVDKDMIVEAIKLNRTRGIDRIVNVGHTLDIDIIWDGYPLIEYLTRYIAY